MGISVTNPLLEKWSAAFRGAQHPPGPDWLQTLRDDAARQLSESGLPDRKTEAWKYTPMRFLEALGPEVAGAAEADAAEAVFAEPVIGNAEAVIDIANGLLCDKLPHSVEGVAVMPFGQGVERFEEKLQGLLGGLELQGSGRAFAALNTAFLGPGLLIHVGSNVKAGPFLVRWAFSGGDAALLGNFRMVVLLEPGSELELVEQYETVDATANALNVVTQVEIGEGASLDHVRVQNESEAAALLTSTSVVQAKGSRYRYTGFDLGGGLVRHELSAMLSGRGAEADFRGAFVLDHRRHVDNHVSVDHAAPGCRSAQFFRGVLGGRSRGVFNGRALIRPGADGSVVRQSNANLLLSPLAEMDTKPELEIYADEVEASHGATVGQLDEAAVFYLRSRGLAEARARRMLTSAFCNSVTDLLEDRELARKASALLDAAMPDGLPESAEEN